MNLWTDDKTAELIRLWPTGKSQSELAELLGEKFTPGMVAGKLRRLGLRRPEDVKALLRSNPHRREMLARAARNRFSEAEGAYIRATAHLPIEDVAKALNRPLGSIGPRRLRLGIRVRDWTAEEEAILRQMVGQNIGQNRICARLRMGTERIRAKMKALGISRTVTASTISDAQLKDIYLLRRRGVSIPRIALRLGLSEWVVGEESRAMLAAEQELSAPEDEPFVQRLLADGGMPRFAEDARRFLAPVWVGPDNRPWIPPERRAAA